MPERILIIGSSGAGKSTLARALARHLDLPLIHLDRHYWQPGWVPMAEASWAAEVERLIALPAWVMDGNYNATMPQRMARADAIVHMDFPRRVCLGRIARRIVTTYGQVREDMAPGCPEQIDWEFLQWVWNFPRRSRPKNLALLQGFRGPIVTLRNPSGVRTWQQAGYSFGDMVELGAISR